MREHGKIIMKGSARRVCSGMSDLPNSPDNVIEQVPRHVGTSGIILSDVVV